jgi:hypothetical protein
MDLDERFKQYKLNAYITDYNPDQTAQEMLAPKQEVLKPVPQTTYEQGLESAGIKIEQFAKFLESVGSVNIGGMEFTLRDLLPVDRGTSATLKDLGSGMDLTHGQGMTTSLAPEFQKNALSAAVELSLAGKAGELISKPIGKIAKKAKENKAAVAGGVAAITATQSQKQESK